MKTKVMKIGEYLKEPATLWKIIVLVFALGGLRFQLNNSIESNRQLSKENKAQIIAVKDAQSNMSVSYTKLLTNQQWIMTSLNEIKNKIK